MAIAPLSLLLPSRCFFFCFLLHFVMVPCSLGSTNVVDLSYDFYNKSCPNVEQIIHNVVSQKLLEAPVTAAGALRIFFHDCFVEMLWQLPLGTWLTWWEAQDGMCKRVEEMGWFPRLQELLETSLRQKNSQLISLFKSKGLSVLNMVALSGGHTIGFSHCMEFMPGIYSYNKTFDIDPTMNQDYALSLRGPCPRKNLDPTVVALNDVTTAFIFDYAYGGNLQKGLGLLSTDQMLGVDSLTRPYVNIMARDQQIFFNYFVKAMIKMSNIGVKTGSNGEIRSDCGSFNG
ncbi:hypothetical protein POUND7_015977 [Theobroma cacao]